MSIDENLYPIITEFSIEHLKTHDEVFLRIELLGSVNSELYGEILDWANRMNLQITKNNEKDFLILNKSS